MKPTEEQVKEFRTIEKRCREKGKTQGKGEINILLADFISKLLKNAEV